MKNKIEKFEDLNVWQNAMELSIKTYRVFQNCRDYGFKDQIFRASVSIPSNIAEGYERQTNKEFIQYLYIAKGSAGELRTQLLIASQLEYIKEENFQVLLDLSKQVSSQLYKSIKTRKERFS